jgi:hypothetical protein
MEKKFNLSFIKKLKLTSLQMELHRSNERYTESGCPRFQYGPSLGHRRLRRNEKSVDRGSLQSGNEHVDLRSRHGISRRGCRRWGHTR